MNTWCPFLIFRMLYIYHTTCNNECFYIHPAYLCWHWIAELLVLGKNSSRKTTAELSMFSLHSIASRTPSSSTWLPVTIYIYIKCLKFRDHSYLPSPLHFQGTRPFFGEQRNNAMPFFSTQEAGLQDETYQNIQGRNLRTHQMMGPFSLVDSPFFPEDSPNNLGEDIILKASLKLHHFFGNHKQNQWRFESL